MTAWPSYVTARQWSNPQLSIVTFLKDDKMEFVNKRGKIISSELFNTPMFYILLPPNTKVGAPAINPETWVEWSNWNEFFS